MWYNLSMDRLERFKSFSLHPMFKKIFTRLTPFEEMMAEKFIVDNESLNKDNFEYAVNRMFLDRAKTRHWKEIVELLTCSNS
jgi:hypothetical protein